MSDRRSGRICFGVSQPIRSGEQFQMIRRKTAPTSTAAKGRQARPLSGDAPGADVLAAVSGAYGVSASAVMVVVQPFLRT